MALSLRIGITCYPTIGGSGVLASALGEELAQRGHEVHFIAYEKPFRLAPSTPNIHFHLVDVSTYALFKYPDYTLPLSVKMAEVSRRHSLDILHVHYAVPHATAAILARAMLPPPPPPHPRIITTLHGTDTTLLGDNPSYRPAILHALNCSDAVTAVSEFLRVETRRRIGFSGPVEVIPNFYPLRSPRRTRQEVRQDLGLGDEVLLLHCSNLRPLKRIDLLLETAAQIASRTPFKLLILAGDSFAPHMPHVQRLGLQGRILIREQANDHEDYMNAADLGIYTSENESFCLSILEGMWHGVPSAAMAVGGILEVVADGSTGRLISFGDVPALALAVRELIDDPDRRTVMGAAAKVHAHQHFSPAVVVPQYEALYHRLLGRN